MPFWSLLGDLAIFGILLILGQVLRAVFAPLRRARLPASVIAGVLALAFGPNGLDGLPLSSQMAGYPEILIVLVFAATALGFAPPAHNPRREIGEILSHVTFGIFAQYGWGLMIAILVLQQLWSLPQGFGFVLGIGFWGGPGTTVAAASGFPPGVRDEIMSLGLTAWMVGVVTSIFLGALIVNLRAPEVGNPSSDMASRTLGSGLIPEGRRRSLGEETISSAAMESLTLQLVIVIIPAVAGWQLSRLLREVWPGLIVPAFALALMAGFALRGGMRITGTGAYLDRRTIGRISGVCTDFLIVSGMAVIRIPLVIEYWVPLVILLSFGVALSVWQALFLGPRMFTRAWLEKSMLVFGINTGTLAQGILLLRMVDPQGRTGTLGLYGIVDLLIKPLTIGIVVLGPMLITGGLSLPFGATCSVLAFVPLVLARKMGWWRPTGRFGFQSAQMKGRSE